MWVIFETDTGNEIDRTEDHKEAHSIKADFENNNEYGYTASIRWED